MGTVLTFRYFFPFKTLQAASEPIAASLFKQRFVLNDIFVGKVLVKKGFRKAT